MMATRIAMRKIPGAAKVQQCAFYLETHVLACKNQRSVLGVHEYCAYTGWCARMGHRFTLLSAYWNLTGLFSYFVLNHCEHAIAYTMLMLGLGPRSSISVVLSSILISADIGSCPSSLMPIQSKFDSLWLCSCSLCDISSANSTQPSRYVF